MTQAPRPPASPTPPKGRDPVTEEALPLDEAADPAIPPTEPPVETALDDDEGGADPIDPETGRPYSETDPGTNAPLAERRGGAPEEI